jgi:hypothetical protein
MPISMGMKKRIYDCFNRPVDVIGKERYKEEADDASISKMTSWLNDRKSKENEYVQENSGRH